MAITVEVPSLGESITEAVIGNWLKAEGDFVAADEPIAELETDKVAVEVNAPAAGVLKKILAKKGAKVEVGAVIAEIEPGAAPAAKKPETPAAKPKPAADNTEASAPERPKAREAAPKAALPKAKAPSGGEERVPMSPLRKRIAERLKVAQNTAAILTTFNEVDMSAVVASRGRNQELFQKKHGIKLGFMSYFVKACVHVLREIPAVNASIEGDEIVYKNHYDIGVAVSTDQGLVVPVVKGADALSFAEIEAAISDFGARARAGKLKLEDLQGGTFTISNGGVFGSLLSTPILNPPQSAILGLHKIEERPVALGGQIVIRPMMYLALSYDHRIIDGREAVTFLVRVKDLLENPDRLLLDL